MNGATDAFWGPFFPTLAVFFSFCLHSFLWNGRQSPQDLCGGLWFSSLDSHVYFCLLVTSKQVARCDGWGCYWCNQVCPADAFFALRSVADLWFSPVGFFSFSLSGDVDWLFTPSSLFVGKIRTSNGWEDFVDAREPVWQWSGGCKATLP